MTETIESLRLALEIEQAHNAVLREAIEACAGAEGDHLHGFDADFARKTLKQVVSSNAGVKAHNRLRWAEVCASISERTEWSSLTLRYLCRRCFSPEHKEHLQDCPFGKWRRAQL